MVGLFLTIKAYFSLRFVLIYNVDKDKPELFKMNIEPLEIENKMIIFPEKQLKNRK